MKRWLQYALVIVLVGSTAASSQAEICPMKWQSGQPKPCAMMPALKMSHHHATQAAGHDCCPKSATHYGAAQPQCRPVELSAGTSEMTCCSLDPQPAQSQVVSIKRPLTVAIAHATPATPSRASMVHASPLPTPQNPVFRLKEDLRI